MVDPLGGVGWGQTEKLTVPRRAAGGTNLLNEGTFQAYFVVAQAVQKDFSTSRLPAAQFLCKLGVTVQRPGAMPVGDYQERVTLHAELREHIKDSSNPLFVSRGHVMDGDEKLPGPSDGVHSIERARR